MESNAAEIISTIQAAHINRNPSPQHDINPSTAASQRIPVDVSRPSHIDSPPSSPSAIPVSARPHQRRTKMPPLPDLRFEQSYLASLPPGASPVVIAWITARDQVMMPLIQGVVWTLVLSWWRHWNRGAQLAGQGVGARIRRWWWRVNHWELPPDVKGDKVGHFKANEVEEFYKSQMGAGGD